MYKKDYQVGRERHIQECLQQISLVYSEIATRVARNGQFEVGVGRNSRKILLF